MADHLEQGVTDGCKPTRVQRTNLGPLQGEQVLLTTEPFFPVLCARTIDSLPARD